MADAGGNLVSFGLTESELERLAAAVNDPAQSAIIRDVLGADGYFAAQVLADSHRTAVNARRALISAENKTGRTIAEVLRYIGGAAVQGVKKAGQELQHDTKEVIVAEEPVEITTETVVAAEKIDVQPSLASEAPYIADFLRLSFNTNPRIGELKSADKARLVEGIVNALNLPSVDLVMTISEQLLDFMLHKSDRDIGASIGVSARTVSKNRGIVVKALMALPQERLDAIIDKILGPIEATENTVTGNDVAGDSSETIHSESIVRETHGGIDAMSLESNKAEEVPFAGIDADDTTALTEHIEVDVAEVEPDKSIDSARKEEILRTASDQNWTAEELLSLTVLLGYEYAGVAVIDVQPVLDKLAQLELSSVEIGYIVSRKEQINKTDARQLPEAEPEVQSGGDQSLPLGRPRKRERNTKRKQLKDQE